MKYLMGLALPSSVMDTREYRHSIIATASP